MSHKRGVSRTLDHPAAVPTYNNAGFVQYKEEQIRREL
jgi:hypothetical protein